MPEGVAEGIVRGLYRLREAPALDPGAPRVRLVGSGSILEQVVAAQTLLAERFGIAAEVYSAPSFPLLRRDALAAERWSRLHPDKPARVPYVGEVLGPDGGPVVLATDWMKALPDMVARWLPAGSVSLGTDGFGRSDTREALRAFFQIDPPAIAAAAVSSLARAGTLPAKRAVAALRDLGLDPDAPEPLDL
jgi:pyruvate dehydrogenase E1 component